MAKGADYERDICRLLSRWWSEGHSDNVFWRTAQSGGWATSRRKAGKSAQTHVCDITDIDPKGRGKPFLDCFAVEIKRGYSGLKRGQHKKGQGHGASLADLLDVPIHAHHPPTYEEWFDQVFAARDNSGAASYMLIHKRDAREAVVMISLNMFTYFKIGDKLEGQNNNVNYGIVRYVLRQGFTIAIACMLLEDFIRFVTPQEIRDFVKVAKSPYLASGGDSGYG